MEETLVEIEILEVKNPWEFTARVVFPWEQNAYEKACQDWQIDMEIVEERTVVNHAVLKGELYAVKSSKDHRWNRVLAEQVLQTGRGIRVKCFYVDIGDRETLPLFRCFELNDQYKERRVPFRIRTLGLWGLQPVSMQMSVSDGGGFDTPLRPSKKWDTSAENFFRKLINDCDKASVQVKKRPPNGKIPVVLHLEIGDQNINVNETLVTEEYACHTAEAEAAESGSDSSSSSIPHQPSELKERIQSLKRSSPLSDSCGREPMPAPQKRPNSVGPTTGIRNFDVNDMSEEIVGENAQDENLSETSICTVLKKINLFKEQTNSPADAEIVHKEQGVLRLETKAVARADRSPNNSGDGRYASSPSSLPNSPRAGGNAKHIPPLAKSPPLALNRVTGDLRAVPLSSGAPEHSQKTSPSVLTSSDMYALNREVIGDLTTVPSSSAAAEHSQKTSPSVQTSSNKYALNNEGISDLTTVPSSAAAELSQKTSPSVPTPSKKYVPMFKTPGTSLSLQAAFGMTKVQNAQPASPSQHPVAVNLADIFSRNSSTMPQHKPQSSSAIESSSQAEMSDSSDVSTAAIHPSTIASILAKKSPQSAAYVSSSSSVSSSSLSSVAHTALAQKLDHDLSSLAAETTSQLSSPSPIAIGGRGRGLRKLYSEDVKSEVGRLPTPSPSVASSDVRTKNLIHDAMTESQTLTTASGTFTVPTKANHVQAVSDTTATTTTTVGQSVTAGIAFTDHNFNNNNNNVTLETGWPKDSSKNKVTQLLAVKKNNLKLEPGFLKDPSKNEVTEPLAVQNNHLKLQTGSPKDPSKNDVTQPFAVDEKMYDNVLLDSEIVHAALINHTDYKGARPKTGPWLAASKTSPETSPGVGNSILNLGVANYTQAPSGSSAETSSSSTAGGNAEEKSHSVASTFACDGKSDSKSALSCVDSKVEHKSHSAFVSGEKSDSESALACDSANASPTTTSPHTTTAKLSSGLKSRQPFSRDDILKRMFNKRCDVNAAASDTESAIKEWDGSLCTAATRDYNSDTGMQGGDATKSRLCEVSPQSLSRSGSDEFEGSKTAVRNVDESFSSRQPAEASTIPEEDSIVFNTRQKVRGRAMGNLLLEKLGVSTKHSGSDEDAGGARIPQVWRPDRPPPDPFLGTMVFGTDAPPAVYFLEDIPFHYDVVAYMVRQAMKTPWSIQANTWPAILRGEHVIGIVPPHKGKTTAYLPALLTELLQFHKYLKLPSTGGPKAIILVPSCRKADSLHKYLREVLIKKQLNVLRIYGCDDTQLMPVMRGCDILVATPHCLLRMLESRYMTLSRLCHVVLDGAETLVEHFTLQIQGIMTRFAEDLNRQLYTMVPRQIMAFGSQWTPGFASFCHNYMTHPNPILVFASRLEASIYGHVKQEVHMCFERERMTTLRKLLEGVMADKENLRHIVIVTARPDQVKVIAQELHSLCVHAHVIDPFSKNSLDEIAEHVVQWGTQTGSSPVLVVTDDNVTELRVTSADLVIHFDIPGSKTKFGNRLALMLEHFQDKYNPQETERAQAVSHLLVTEDEETAKHIHSLRSFLERSRTSIPKPMANLIKGMENYKNSDAHRPLCMQLKRFGLCRDQQRCESRHLLMPCDYEVKGQEDQGSWLPNSGCVKFRVLEVKDASHFYVMLLEHQTAPGQPKDDLQHTYTELTMDLAMIMASPKNQHPYFLEQGTSQLAVVKDLDGLFHRAQIISTLASTLKAKQVQVFCVDEGRSLIVRPEQLLKVPEKLRDIPPLAVEVFVSRIRPVDGDTEWSSSSTDYVWKLIRENNRELYGNVVLRLKNSLWLDPVAGQIKFPTIQMSAVSMTIRSSLLQRGKADDSPDHLQTLYKLCEGQVEIPQKLYEKYMHIQPRPRIETETLTENKEYHKVFMSHIENPELFYVIKADMNEKLEDMETKLNTCVNKEIDKRKEITASAIATAATTVSTPTTIATQTTTATTSATAATTAADSSTSATTASATTSTNPTTTATAKTPPQTPQKATQGSPTSSRASVGSQSPKSVSQANSLPSQIESAYAGKPESDLEPEGFCAAKIQDTLDEEESKWKRGRLLEKRGGKWAVYYLDYGYVKEVGEREIFYPLPAEFLILPAQAIECRLASVLPKGEAWDGPSKDALVDLSFFLSGDEKYIWAKVLDRADAMYAGSSKLLVDLIDTSSQIDTEINFAQQLVWAGVVRTEDSGIEPLFPKVTFNSRKMYKCVEEKICDLCAALYWAESEDKARHFVKLITDSLVASINVNGNASAGHQGLQAAVSMIGYITWPKATDVHASLLGAVTKCILEHPELCAEVIGTSMANRLMYCIEQTRYPHKQTQAIKTACMLSTVEGFRDCVIREEVISVIADVLCADDHYPGTLELVCLFLSSQLRSTNRVCANVMDERHMAETVLELLDGMCEVESQEALLSLIAAIAIWKGLQPQLMREAAVAQLMRVMRSRPSDNCILHLVRTCESLCRQRRNKRILIEAKLVLILQELLDQGVEGLARELCEELNSMLCFKAPQQEVVSGQYYTVDSATGMSKAMASPMVKWSQNSFRVLLTVSVKGAKDSDFTITDNSVALRCESEGKLYGFNLTLYDSLVVEKCRITAKASEVLLSLYKQEKGIWSRLLKEKRKLPYLKLDFDNLVDSEDEEVEDEGNIALLSREKKSCLPDLSNTKEEDLKIEGQYFSYSESMSSEDSDDPYRGLDIPDLENTDDEERFGEIFDTDAILDHFVYSNQGQRTSQLSIKEVSEKESGSN